MTHQILFLVGLHTLSNFFHYKTQKQPILRHLSLFALYFDSQVNLYAEALSQGLRRNIGANIPLRVGNIFSVVFLFNIIFQGVAR